MRESSSFAERRAPDTVDRLERAAKARFRSGEILQEEGRRLEAVYFYGFTAEMCLASAYFRNVGFGGLDPIDRDTRNRRMAKARQTLDEKEEPLMSNDPHPVVGWARFLRWQRSQSGKLSFPAVQRLNEAVNKAVVIYSYWRPELRYQTVEFKERKTEVVRRAAKWILDNQGSLQEG